MEEITPRRDIQIANRADLCVIHIHDGKFRGIATIHPQARVVERPDGLVREVGVGIGVGVLRHDEGDDPVFHVGGDGGVVDGCGGRQLLGVIKQKTP